MTTINKQTEVFVADDGREFISRCECIKYEKNILEFEKNIRYFRFDTKRDLNETGSFYNCNYAAVYIHGLDDCYYEILLQYLIDLYKGKVIQENVQGYGVTSTFLIKPCTKDEYLKAIPRKWGGVNTETQKILLSTIPIDGFPKNIDIISKHVNYR